MSGYMDKSLPKLSTVSLQIPDDAPMFDSPVDDENNRNVENVRMQLVWDKEMKGAGKMQRHKRVAVLLLSWDPEDDDLKVKAEVEDLARVFRLQYNFEVCSRLLNTKKKAQHQVNQHLANFVVEHDGEDTLLIVYYAGHGIPGSEDGHFRLAANQWPNTKKNRELNEVVWVKAEANIRDVEADTLLIFDCCHAAALGRSGASGSWSRRIFEFLGACGPDAITRIPGDTSFTRALIWALEDFANNSKEFTTAQLKNSITTGAPRFPDDQYPVLNERHEFSLKKIIIAPLPKDGERTESPTLRSADSQVDAPSDCLDIRVMLTRHPKEDDIKSLCNALKPLIRDEDIPVQSFAWGGLNQDHNLTQDGNGSSPSKLYDVVRSAVRRFSERGSRRQREAIEDASILLTPLPRSGIDDPLNISFPPSPLLSASDHTQASTSITVMAEKKIKGMRSRKRRRQT